MAERRSPWRTVRIIDNPSDRPSCPNTRCHMSHVVVVWLPRLFRCTTCGTTFEATP